MSASGMFERQRTVALEMLARNEPRGSMLLNRYATGSLMNISYQMPMPIGAPSSLLTAWLRRYSWSSRMSSTSHLPKKCTMNAAGPTATGRKYNPGSVNTARTLPNSVYTRHVRSSTTANNPNNRINPSTSGSMKNIATNTAKATLRNSMLGNPVYGFDARKICCAFVYNPSRTLRR